MFLTSGLLKLDTFMEVNPTATLILNSRYYSSKLNESIGSNTCHGRLEWNPLDLSFLLLTSLVRNLFKRIHSFDQDRTTSKQK